MHAKHAISKHAIWAGLALSLFAAPSSAALWSLGNEVVGAGFTTRVTLSLTGNQITSGAQVDILVPKDFKVTATAVNGGACAVLPGSNGLVVRALAVYPISAPFPTAPVAYCELTVSTSIRTRSNWFNLDNALCFDTWGTQTACFLDRGYVTVVN
jgi:hypothetical protein